MKNKNIDKRLDQLGKKTQEGVYGNEALKDSLAYINQEVIPLKLS